MSNNIIYNYLPSFYKDFLVDNSGSPILDPLFDNYSNCMGDLYYQALQISKVPYLETAPSYFKETYKTIDTSYSNRYKTGYKIDNSIIYFDTIYLDGLFTIAYSGTYEIYHDINNNIRYIVFLNGSPIWMDQNCVFTQYCYNDLKTLQNTYGFLLQYSKNIPDYNLSSGDLLINFTAIDTTYTQYKNELLGILYGQMHGPTAESLNRMMGIYCGLPYSKVNGIVRSITANTSISVQDNSTGKLNIYTLSDTSTYSIGQIISKYQILQMVNVPYRIFDMFSNPARFTQILIQNNSLNVLNLLTLNHGDNEKDASLNYDSVIKWDDSTLYWDMGNNTGASYVTPGDIVAPYGMYSINNVNDTQFNTWYDSRFNTGNPTPVLYEMFKNLIIMEVNMDGDKIYGTNAYLNDLKLILNKLIPSYTKILYILYSGGCG